MNYEKYVQPRYNAIPVPEDSAWREIPGWPGYWMSQHCQVFSMKKGIVLREWSNGWYDTFVTVRREGKSYSRKVISLYNLTFADMLEVW